MMYDGKPVLNNFGLVDSIVDRVHVNGLTTTIFQVIDNGILRITTNVKKLNGDRASGDVYTFGFYSLPHCDVRE